MAENETAKCDENKTVKSDDSKPENLSCNPPEADPFAYVKNACFTSEIFKIEVRGLPRFYGIGEFRKLLNVKLKLDCNKVKSPSNRSKWLYACFRSEEERDKAITALSGFKWKGSVLSAKVADPAPDPLVMKRRQEENPDDVSSKKMKITSVEDQTKALLNSTAPLWNVPYEEQVAQKTQQAKDILKKLGKELIKHNPTLFEYIQKQRELNDGLPCKLYETRCLKDDYNNYRNKCEFTIGRDEVTGEKRIGFRLGSYASGSVGVGPIDNLPIIPDIMKKTVKAFEKFVQQSDLDVFSPETLQGYWKQLTLRYSVGTGELMAIIGLNPQSMTSEQLSSVKDSLKDFFNNDELLKSSVTSFYFQLLGRREKGSDLSNSLELLLGNKHIEEVLMGLRFKISPESFFQVNTKCAEVLMNSVKELADVNKETCLVDVCCGAGTIGLSLAKDATKVLGIEIVGQAVQAAQENARNNKIDNCEFFCGKADEIFSSVVSRIPSDKPIIAIVDPPRAGLHQNAIVMLRKATNIKRLVYLSCYSQLAIKNFVEMGRPESKTLCGNPFLPTSGVVVDMFPHTNHYELVIYFERVDTSQFKTPKD